jgi:acetolactate synthase-1/2/3 large subunit
MKLSEYVIKFFEKKGIDRVFLVNGGSIAFMIDTFKKFKKIKYVCSVHEQGAAMMADGYARIKKKPGITMVTSGPGAQNLITGIASSWFDSIPTIHICGQVNSNDFLISKKKYPVRQSGFQETDIVSISKPITKFSYRLKNPDEIVKILNFAYETAIHGRPGPVLLDIPMNFQNQLINIKRKFSLPSLKKSKNIKLNFLKNIKKKIISSKKPLVIIGGGIETSETKNELLSFLNNTNIPVVASWAGYGACDKSIKNFRGTIGVYGSRVANIMLQKSDLILNLGCRLDTRVLGGRRNEFAPNAKIISVDIDKNELNKTKGLKIHYKIECDLKLFLNKFNSIFKNEKLKINDWNYEIDKLKNEFENFGKKKNKSNNFVNPYYLFEKFSQKIKKNDIIVGDTGAHLTWAVQSIKLKENNKFISSFGNSPMGFALPASIGASFANKKTRVLSINGDASIQLNVQELQTIKNYKLNLKIFILNNSGFGIIKQFQDSYLKGRYEASNYNTGVTNPNFKFLAKAYGLNYELINNDNVIIKKLNKIMANKKTTIVEIKIHPNEKIVPKLLFGKSLEEMHPSLSKKQLLYIKKL